MPQSRVEKSPQHEVIMVVALAVINRETTQVYEANGRLVTGDIPCTRICSGDLRGEILRSQTKTICKCSNDPMSNADEGGGFLFFLLFFFFLPAPDQETTLADGGPPVVCTRSNPKRNSKLVMNAPSRRGQHAVSPLPRRDARCRQA